MKRPMREQIFPGAQLGMMRPGVRRHDVITIDRVGPPEQPINVDGQVLFPTEVAFHGNDIWTYPQIMPIEDMTGERQTDSYVFYLLDG